MAQTFNFELDSLSISTTRSLVEDTDWVVFTLAVNPQGGLGTPQTQLKSMGAIRNGTHTIELSFSGVTVNPTDTVTLNYIVLNCENTFSNNNLIEQTMASVASTLSTLTSVPNPPKGSATIPQFSSALQVLSGWLAGEFYALTVQDDPGGNPIGFAGCDGSVAAEQSHFTYQQLINDTGGSRFNQNTVHAGNPSGAGCGSNSQYTVSWHVESPTKIVPAVIDMPYKKAEAAITAAGLAWGLVRGSTTGLVTQQSKPAFTAVSPGTQILLTLDNNR